MHTRVPKLCVLTLTHQLHAHLPVLVLTPWVKVLLSPCGPMRPTPLLLDKLFPLRRLHAPMRPDTLFPLYCLHVQFTLLAQFSPVLFMQLLLSLEGLPSLQPHGKL